MATYVCECGKEADWFMRPADHKASHRMDPLIGRASCHEHLIQDLRREIEFYKQAGLPGAARIFDVSGYKTSGPVPGDPTTE